MAGRTVVHVSWVDLVDSTHLATAFSYESLDQIIGTCMLLLYSLPASDKPSPINPVALEWATAVDRYRCEVRQPTQVRKDHQKGTPIRPTVPPGPDALTRPSALRSWSHFQKRKCYLPWAVRSHPCGAALGGTSPGGDVVPNQPPKPHGMAPCTPVPDGPDMHYKGKLVRI